MKLQRLKVTNYKSIADLDLELRDLNVVVGPNGAGKTSLLECFTLLREAAKGNLAKTISARGGFHEVIFKGDPRVAGTWELSVTVTTVPLEYQLRLGSEGLAYNVSYEALLDRSVKGAAPLMEYDSTKGRILMTRPGLRVDKPRSEPGMESNLAKVARSNKKVHDFKSGLTEMQDYGMLDVSDRAPIRLPQQLQPTQRPGPDGVGLIPAIYTLRSQNEQAFEYLVDSIRAAFPGFTKLEFPLVGAGNATMTWYEEFSDKPFYPNQLSEGTLRYLWLATALLSPGIAPITLIDEPEVSLHPELLKLLAGLLREAAMHSQVIVATHSESLIRWLKPEELIVADKEDGVTTMQWADEKGFDFEKWLHEYTLDQLWLMGEIGGRP